MTMDPSPDAATLIHRVRRFISSPEPAEFDAIALEIHRYQLSRCPVIAALTEDTPPARDALAIPAVPVDLFKSLPIGTVPKEEVKHTFLTSGTTQGKRGAHRFRSLALYELNCLEWARRHIRRWPARTCNLLLDPKHHPESSLSHMVSLFAPESSWHLSNSGLRTKEFIDALGGQPAFIGATSFAVAQLLEEQPTLRLPPGCTLMITGGFKGRKRAFDESSLIGAIRNSLQPDQLISEYGMTELSSQLWGEPGKRYYPPPWLRVYAVDPWTAQPASSGQLRFIDLCNVESSVAIETMDHGIIHDDGSVSLLGRLPNAPVRGCSLTAEEAWDARTRLHGGK